MDHIPILISGIALLFSAYQFVKASEKEDTTQITTVLIKLESISDGIAEIKADMKNVKNDIRQIYERLAQVEASAKSAHKRLDNMKGDH